MAEATASRRAARRLGVVAAMQIGVYSGSNSLATTAAPATQAAAAAATPPPPPAAIGALLALVDSQFNSPRGRSTSSRRRGYGKIVCRRIITTLYIKSLSYCINLAHHKNEAQTETVQSQKGQVRHLCHQSRQPNHKSSFNKCLQLFSQASVGFKAETSHHSSFYILRNRFTRHT